MKKFHVTSSDDCWVSGCRRPATFWLNAPDATYIVCKTHADILCHPRLGPISFKYDIPTLKPSEPCSVDRIPYIDARPLLEL